MIGAPLPISPRLARFSAYCCPSGGKKWILNTAVWWLLLGTLLPVWAATTSVQAEILLQTSPLAGFRYYAGKSVWQSMHEGDALVLVREPANAWDAKAIRVEWHGYKLGYVPRRENAALARLMDHDVQLKARIVRLIPGRNPWRRVLFEIYRPLT